jgi:hypothetical protein
MDECLTKAVKKQGFFTVFYLVELAWLFNFIEITQTRAGLWPVGVLQQLL